MAPSRTRLVLFVLSLGALYLLLRPFLPYSWFSYATRPLWDSSEAPSDLIVHYPFHENAAQACALHSWPTREEEVEIWDAVVVSTEVDLLLLRLHELSPHVSTFFILESSHTFTGQPKPPIVEAALATAAFDPFRDRIRFTYVQGRTLARGESPFTQENELRATMTDILVAALPPPPVPVPVMLFSDVDELPSRDAVALVAACDFGKAVHLGMKEYMYSFAWGMGSDEAGLGSWRGSAVQWKKGRGDASLGEYYRHSKVTEKVLVDAGWHCSWCFRTLDEFVVKAKGYSHTDRYRSPGLLRPAQIQKTICDGNDLAGMLPEGYTWREMAAKWHLLEERSAMHLPTYLTQHPDQFRFLLPRGCVREDAPRAGTT